MYMDNMHKRELNEKYLFSELAGLLTFRCTLNCASRNYPTELVVLW